MVPLRTSESKKSPNLFRVWTSLQNYTKSERKSSESFFPSSSSSSSFIRRRERQRTHTKDFEASNTTTQKRVVSILTPNNKNSRVFFLFCVVTKRVSRFAKRKRTHNALPLKWMVSQESHSTDDDDFNKTKDDFATTTT